MRGEAMENRHARLRGQAAAFRRGPYMYELQWPPSYLRKAIELTSQCRPQRGSVWTNGVHGLTAARFRPAPRTTFACAY